MLAISQFIRMGMMNIFLSIEKNQYIHKLHHFRRMEKKKIVQIYPNFIRKKFCTISVSSEKSEINLHTFMV